VLQDHYLGQYVASCNACVLPPGSGVGDVDAERCRGGHVRVDSMSHILAVHLLLTYARLPAKA